MNLYLEREGKGKEGYMSYSCLDKGVKGGVEKLLYIFLQIYLFSLIDVLFNIYDILTKIMNLCHWNLSSKDRDIHICMSSLRMKGRL